MYNKFPITRIQTHTVSSYIPPYGGDKNVFGRIFQKSITLSIFQILEVGRNIF